MAERGCLKDGHFQNLEVEGNSILKDTTCTVDSPFRGAAKLLVDKDNDISIYTLVSGHTYFWGTATGMQGAAANTHAITFALPPPKQAGEYICILPQNSSAIAALVGFTVVNEATDVILYQAYEASGGGMVQHGTTVAGTHGTNNTMVKLNASHFLIGDEVHCYSMSPKKWLMRIIGRNNIIGAGVITTVIGNVGGYIE